MLWCNVRIGEQKNVNQEDSKKYLQMLGAELQKRQITGEILLADDEVLLLDIKHPEAHRDIDAYLEGDETILDLPIDIEAYFGKNGTIISEVIVSLAKQEGLSHNWLQPALQLLFPLEVSQTQWLEYPGLRVYCSSTDYLLAMKIVTSYPKDMADIRILAKQLCILNEQNMLATITKYVPEQLLTPEIYLFIKRLFEPSQIHFAEETNE